MQAKNKEKLYIFFIVILSVALVILFILSVGGFFLVDSSQPGTSLQLGNSVTIEVDKNKSDSFACNFDGAILAGEVLKQNISVRNTGNDDLFLRAKLTIFTGDGNDPQIELATSGDWAKNDDGYYYFSGNVPSLNSVGFISSIKIAEGQQLKSSSNYIFVFTVETLSTEFDKTLIWGV